MAAVDDEWDSFDEVDERVSRLANDNGHLCKAPCPPEDIESQVKTLIEGLPQPEQEAFFGKEWRGYVTGMVCFLGDNIVRANVHPIPKRSRHKQEVWTAVLRAIKKGPAHDSCA